MRYIVNCANKPIKTLTGLHGINVFLFHIIITLLLDPKKKN
jgi:hypothetical protein